MASPGGPVWPGPGPGYGYQVPPQAMMKPPSRRLLLVVVAIVLAIALVAVVGVVWWLTHRTSDDAGPIPGQLTREFPTEPSVAWKVTADQLGVSALTLSTPVGDGYIDFPAALVDDGGVAVNVESGGDIAGFKNFVAGVNMATGKVWKTQVEAKCPSRIVHHLIACSKPTDYTQQYAYVDVRTGTEAGAAVLPRNSGPIPDPGTADFDGNAVYATGGGATNGSESFRVTKLDGAGHVVWSVTEPVTGNVGSGFSRTTVSGGLVGASFGGVEAVLSAANGSVVSKNVGAGTPLAGGGLFGLESLTQEQSASGVSAGFRIVHPGGAETKLDATFDSSHYQSLLDQPLLTARSRAGSVYVNGRLYGPGSASAQWTTQATADRVVVISPKVTVGVTDSGGLQGLDTTTGRTLWTAPDGTAQKSMTKYGDSVITDGSSVITLGASGTLTATDIATGTVEWKMQGPTPTAGASYHGTGSGSTQAFLYPAGDKFVVVTGDSITAYSATGGGASEPGAAVSHPPAGNKDGGAGGYYTRCGSAPVFSPQKFRTASGGLVVTMKVTARCPGGDVLGAAGTSISVHDGAGLIASGIFDFSGSPIGIAPGSVSGSGSESGGTTIDLTFPPGSFWRLPDTLGIDSAGTDSSTGVSAKPGILVDCDRPDGGAQKASRPSGSTTPSASARSGYTPPGTNVGSTCSAALRSQADSDRSYILSTLNGHWLAQLSSKRSGLVADGRTWDDCAILNEFLALRLRFKDVRMLWSDEWSVFDSKGWWVTVATAIFPGPDDANGWCRQQGFDRDHCFAKLVSTSSGPAGSTKYWN